MTCLEAQSNIMDFIEKKLPDDKAGDFVRHMRKCKTCSEELEIYYTMIVGMHQLDKGRELSSNFKQDLNDELAGIERKIKRSKRFRLSTFSVCLLVALFGIFFLYENTLKRVYDAEQRVIKESQGISYFYDYFGDVIKITKEDEDLFVRYAKKEHVTELTNFQRIHIYHLQHDKAKEGEPEDE